MYIYAQILQKEAFLFPNRSPMWFNNKNERYFCEYLSKILVPAIGFEPIRSRELRILSPVRLPIPPRGHIYSIIHIFMLFEGF